MLDREELGKVAFRETCSYIAEMGSEFGPARLTWEELAEKDRELLRRIGEGVARYVQNVEYPVPDLSLSGYDVDALKEQYAKEALDARGH